VRREVHRTPVPLEERTCGRCGREQQKIGTDISRVLEYVPGHFVEHEHHREKWACGRCKRGVTSAPVPARVIERSAADASLLAHVVVAKYVDHCPLHRLHRMYARSGATIPVSTLCDWVAEVAERVEPIVDHLATRMRQQAYVVRTDATGLKVLDSSSPEHIQRGTIWGYVGDDKDVVFRYTPTGEGASGPWSFLAGRKGYIQADAASVFDRLFGRRAARSGRCG
jgi:transposase